MISPTGLWSKQEKMIVKYYSMLGAHSTWGFF
jgi:hypothetical protein